MERYDAEPQKVESDDLDPRDCSVPNESVNR